MATVRARKRAKKIIKNEQIVEQYPPCDMCDEGETTALFNGRTTAGLENLCAHHFSGWCLVPSKAIRYRLA